LIYYDNFFVACADENSAHQVRARILQNAHALNIEVKGEVNLHSPQSLSVTGLDFLGMHWKTELLGKRVVSLDVHPSKVAEWAREDAPRPGEKTSCRKLAGWVGRGIFATMLGESNLLRTPEGRRWIKLARAIGLAASRHGWDSVLDTPDEMRSAWSSTLKLEAIPHRWTTEGAPPPATSFIVTTDASSTGWGIIIFRKAQDKLEMIGQPMSGVWTPEDSRHIFLKELEVALLGLQRTRELELHNAELVVDNTAVAWALRNGYTRNRTGQDMMERAMWSTSGHAGDVITVISADNPADSPSRGVGIEKERIERLEKVLAERAEGRQWASSERKLWEPDQAFRMVRHEGPCEEDGLASEDETLNNC